MDVVLSACQGVDLVANQVDAMFLAHLHRCDERLVRATSAKRVVRIAEHQSLDAFSSPALQSGDLILMP